MNSANQDTSLLKQEAIACLRAQKTMQAKDVLARACEINPDDDEAWYLLGAANGLLGNHQAAEACCRRALALRPGSTHAMFNLGKALSDQGKYGESSLFFRDVLKLEPKNSNAMNCLAHALTRLNRLDQAKKVCETSLRLAPNDPETHLTMGNLLRQAGHLQPALACYDNALKLNPGLVSALVNKGLTLQAAGRLDDAILCFGLALKTNPHLAEVHYSMGLIHLGRGDRDKAVSSLQSAFENAPGDAKTGMQYATVLRYQGRMDDAMDVYRQILKIDPAHQEANFYLKTIEDGVPPAQIPSAMLKAVYNSEDAARNFEKSLLQKFDYKAPEAMNKAVREVMGQERNKLDVLDLGCGTGLSASLLRDVARKLEGVDISANMIAEAKKKGVYDKLTVADIMEVVDKHENDFDVILSMDVLCFFGDLSEVYKKCARALRQGGVFGFTVEKDESGQDWTFHNHGNFLHSAHYLKRMGQASGFKEIRIEEMVLRKELYGARAGYLCIFQKI
jgi:predicted TPR repeat methyltransferase